MQEGEEQAVPSPCDVRAAVLDLERSAGAVDTLEPPNADPG